MIFTELHRQLGLQPCELTDTMINDAIEAGVVENHALDWKKDFPSDKLANSDFPKDVAAMANAGGGIIVYGVTEDQKAAAGRSHVEFDENRERTLNQVAVTAINPPVFGLRIVALGDDPQAVAVIVPDSVGGPYLIYRGEHFGAPLRNGADTVWMREREVAAAYRARFEEQRRSGAAMASLYAETLAGRDVGNRAWLIAVARPRLAGIGARPSRDDARAVFREAERDVFTYSELGYHPLEYVEWHNPRPGLRRWNASTMRRGQGAPQWNDAQMGLHHDGSVTLAAVVGAHRKGVVDEFFGGGEMVGSTVEFVVADFAALVAANGSALGHDEYDVMVGIEWTGDGPLRLMGMSGFNHILEDEAIPLAHFTPVTTTINSAASDVEFHQQVYDLASDCINQGGLTYLRVITEVPTDDEP